MAKERRLPKAQEAILLRYHTTGDFGKHTWASVKGLLDAGMIEETPNRKLVITRKGREYCDKWHAYIGLNPAKKSGKEFRGTRFRVDFFGDPSTGEYGIYDYKLDKWVGRGFTEKSSDWDLLRERADRMNEEEEAKKLPTRFNPAAEKGIKFIYGVRSAKEKGPRGGRSEVQSVLFDRMEYNEREARAWLKEHGFEADLEDVTKRYLRFRQAKPEEFVRMRTSNPIDRRKVSVYKLAADYKARRLDRSRSWSEFVKDRDLRPEMDAKEFYRYYDTAESKRLLEDVKEEESKRESTPDPEFVDYGRKVEVTIHVGRHSERRTGTIHRTLKGSSGRPVYEVDYGGGDIHRVREQDSLRFLNTGEKNPMDPEIAAATKRALKGLPVAELEAAVRYKDQMYDAARAEGFSDKEATEAAYRAVISKFGRGRKGGRKNPSPSPSVGSKDYQAGYFQANNDHKEHLFKDLKQLKYWLSTFKGAARRTGERRQQFILGYYRYGKDVLGEHVVPREYKRTLSNPSTAQLVEEFHGRPASGETEVEEVERYHKRMAVLGDLTELEVQVSDKRVVPIEFPSSRPQLCANAKGTQLEIIGGDQVLNLLSFPLSDAEAEKELVELGPLHSATYFTDKHHLAGPKYQKEGCEFVHTFGEEGGEKPLLVYNRLSKKLLVVGGSYEVKGEGVVN